MANPLNAAVNIVCIYWLGKVRNLMAAMVGLCKREAGTAAHRRVDSHLAHLPILHRQAYAHAFQAELLIDGDLAGNARLWQTAVGTRGGIAVPYHAVQQYQIAHVACHGPCKHGQSTSQMFSQCQCLYHMTGHAQAWQCHSMPCSLLGHQWAMGCPWHLTSTEQGSSIYNGILPTYGVSSKAGRY